MSKVLLVEDDMLQRMSLSADIEEAGYAVIEAPDAASALLALQGDTEVALMVADLDLGPGLDGIDVAELLREKHPDLMVIYVTARPTPAMRDGRNPREACLPKPLRTGELVALMRQMI